MRYEANATCVSEGAELLRMDNGVLRYFVGDRFFKENIVQSRLQIPHFWIGAKMDVS